MNRCGCEDGGNCTKISLCEYLNYRDEIEQLMNDVEISVNRMESIIRNDLYSHRVSKVVQQIDECQTLLKNSGKWFYSYDGAYWFSTVEAAVIGYRYVQQGNDRG